MAAEITIRVEGHIAIATVHGREIRYVRDGSRTSQLGVTRRECDETIGGIVASDPLMRLACSLLDIENLYEDVDWWETLDEDSADDLADII